MEVAVKSLRMDPDGRRATVVCSLKRRFRPRGRNVVSPPADTQTITLEPRGDGWMIVEIR